MDSPFTFTRAIDRKQPFSANPSVADSSASRPDMGRDGPRHEPAVRLLNDTQPPAAVPKALESMLKTTTETGDIGIFSTKPSRFPPLNSPRRSSNHNDSGLLRPQRVFQPYGVPSIDDRRLLPSYARDVSTERGSIYAGSSPPKSGRVLSDPDYRAYSMVQASCSRLSNHRSFTSLRSQVEVSELLQRPKSPFAYPPNLRGAGFSPSSPASTDESGVDPHRRSGVDRILQGTSHSTSSPSSLYAQKRMPPVVLPPEANKSASSLVRRPIPPRRSSSPLVLEKNRNSEGYRSRKDAPTSMNTSPTRSTSSRESTINIYLVKSPPSNTIAPVKNDLASQQYDCTEDFDAENLQCSVVIEPARQLRTTASIPEEQVESIDRGSVIALDPRNPIRTLDNRNSISSSSASIYQMDAQDTQDTQDPNASSYGANDLGLSGKASFTTPYPLHKPSLARTETQEDIKQVRLSASGHGTLELGSHAETAFNHSSFGLLELRDPQSRDVLGTKQREHNSATNNPVTGHKEIAEQSTFGSDHGNQARKTSLHQSQDRSGDFTVTSRVSKQQWKQNNPTGSTNSLPPEFSSVSLSSKENNQWHQKHSPERTSSLGFTSQHQKIMKLNSSSSVDKGAADATGVVTLSENTDRLQTAYSTANVIMPALERTTADSPTIPEQTIKHRVLSHRRISPPVSFPNRQRKEGLQVSKHPPKYNHFHQRGLQGQYMIAQEGKNSLNLVPDIPRKSVSREGAPLLAPKPVSPARQLELKNSVPHLMQALPPFQPDELSRENSPTAETELACRFSPLVRQSGEAATDGAQSTSRLSKSSNAIADSNTHYLAEAPKIQSDTPPASSVGKRAAEEAPRSLPGHSRMRLKLRKSIVLPQTSADGSQHWDFEGSRAQSKHPQNTLQPSSLQIKEQKGSPLPKFKLRVTRASISTPDTVRINRGPGACKPMVDSNLRDPPDLFTPSGGIERIFRQVSRHLHPRKASPKSSQQTGENSLAPDHPSKTVATDTRGSHLLQVRPSIPGLINSTEFQSYFSDDSSNAQGHHSLRKRISNLKVRLALPYYSKGGARSYDDVSWRQRNYLEDPATRSVPNLDTGDIGIDEVQLRPSTENDRLLKLKEKFSRWLKGARSAIKSRMKSLSSNGGRGGGTA